MKTVSAQITHKTDVGGVLMNLSSAQAVAQAFQSIMSTTKIASPAQNGMGLRFSGCTAANEVASLSCVQNVIRFLETYC